MVAADGREYISVMVERGETPAARRARLIARWGLSSREAEVLAFIGGNKTGPEIVILLAIDHDTMLRVAPRLAPPKSPSFRLDASEGLAAEVLASFGRDPAKGLVH